MPDRYTRYTVTLLGDFSPYGGALRYTVLLRIRCNVTPHWTANEERNVQ